MTPGLNFILPQPATRPPGQEVESKSPALPFVTQKNPPPEKFQAVMERLVEIFSRANSSPKAKTGQTTLPAASPEKKDETGKVGAELANVANPPAAEIKLDLTAMGNVLISPVAAPIVADLSSKPELGKQKAEVLVPQNKIAKVSSSTPDSIPNSNPTVVTTSVLPAKDTGISTASVKVEQPNLPATLAKSEVNSSTATPTVPAETKPVLPEIFSTIPTGTPPSEKFGNEKPATKPADGTNQPQKQPATITITVQKSAAGDQKPGVGGQNPLNLNSQPPTSGFASSFRPSSDSHAGTAVAQQDAPMKMAPKKTNFSGPEQKLPGTAASIGVKARENLPTSQPTVVSGPQPIAVGSTASRDPLDAVHEMTLSPAPASAPAGQRMQELVSLQVMRLHESGADEMHVVIKPDTGVQLSLNLQQRDGNVQVQAVLDRGNFDLLSRHWPELQQQLESRGVRVAPLASADQSLGGGSEGFRQPTTPQGQHAGDDVEPDETPAALIPGLPPATATASASRISSRQLETWA